jgi:hypothetical protein
MRGSRGAARHFRTRSALAAPARSPTGDCRIRNRLDPDEDVGTSRRSMEGKQSMEQSPVESDPATAATLTTDRRLPPRMSDPVGGRGRSEVAGSRSPSAFHQSWRRNTVPFGNVRTRPRRQAGPESDDRASGAGSSPAARCDPDPRGDFGGRDQERPYRRFHHPLDDARQRYVSRLREHLFRGQEPARVVRDLEGGGSSGGSFPRGGPEPSVRHEEWWKLVVPPTRGEVRCIRGRRVFQRIRSGRPSRSARVRHNLVRAAIVVVVGDLSTTGLGTILMPDTGPRLFSLSEGHGPTLVDVIGVVLLVAGWAALDVGTPARAPLPARRTRDDGCRRDHCCRASALVDAGRPRHLVDRRCVRARGYPTDRCGEVTLARSGCF